MRIGGIVLCGGLSSRMGRPKAWLPFGDEFLLQQIVRIVREVVNPVAVVAAPNQDVPPLPSDVRIVRDEVEGRGPLQGLAAGMAALDGKAEAAFVSSCDVPLLTPDFVRSVISFLASGGLQSAVTSNQHWTDAPRSPSIAVPRVNDYVHPLAAAYHLSVLPHVRAMLAANRFRLLDLFDRVPTRFLEARELPDLDSLRNVNTPEEFAAASGCSSIDDEAR